MKSAAVWKENLPDELVGARVVLSESNISTTVAAPMHGRVDQVFLAKSGWLVLVDTKRRKSAKVFLKDVIQLSVYRFILERSCKDIFGSVAPVSGTGYIRIASGSKTAYVPVKLLQSAQVINIWNRYWQLRTEKLAAKPRIPEPSACQSCPKKANCPVGVKIPDKIRE